jgi:hypothetical protein
MSNLLTLTQDEIDRYNIKGKQVGDVITAEEYSKLQKEYESKQKRASKEDASAEDDKKTVKK